MIITFNVMTYRFIFLFLLFATFGLYAQSDSISLTNPSFEDIPRHSKPPRGWFDCGFDAETPPDVQPSGAFEVAKPAKDGNTYLGMVVRDNDTWEAVGQRLKTKLQGGKCYEFSLDLSRSELYISVSRLTDSDVNYTTPAKVRVWGGNRYCAKSELLGETSLVVNTRWLTYNMRFEPTQSHSYIVIEAFYKTPTLFPYNGNILIDNASPIIMVPCEEEELVLADVIPPVEEEQPASSTAAPKPPTTPAPAETQPTRQPEPAISAPIVSDEPARPSTPRPSRVNTKPESEFEGIKRSEMKAGQTIQLRSLFFEADSSQITTRSFDTLEKLYTFLSDNGDIKVEIGGHTNSVPPDAYCDKLSAARAKSVADYLVKKGINSQRLTYKGYGKRNPIATNETPSGRRRNQRVEIKILGFDG